MRKMNTRKVGKAITFMLNLVQVKLIWANNHVGLFRFLSDVVIFFS